jgi:mono/diheme cytochrome c family protein
MRLSELRAAEHTPRPISGGTLAISADGSVAVAADPDRDVVYVVRTDSLGVKKLELPAGSDPGRVVFEGPAVAHVVLRGSGRLLRVDLASASVSGEAALCTQPRGLAYHAAQDCMVAACMDGTVVTLAAKSYVERSRVFVAHDLRDVVVGSAGQLFVSRYRSAELIALGSAGGVQATTRPRQGHSTRFDGATPPVAFPAGIVLPDPDAGGPREVSMSPTLAWRAIASRSGTVWMLHQQSQDDVVALSPGGYGGNCAPITQSAVTQFAGDGTPLSTMNVAMLGVSVDVALSPDGQWLAVASPGGYLAGARTLQVYGTTHMAAEFRGENGCSQSALGAGASSQIIAVAFDAAGLLYTFSREPAELEIFSFDAASRLELTRLATISLDRRSVRDTGHELFHTDVGSGLSCASCHGEALDDGHTWVFENIGPRRTQNMRGGLLGTAPFHWDGDMSSFGHLVDDVMTGRMGGFSVSDEYAQALARWIDKQPALILPAIDAAAVARGKLVFASSETKCATCHSGDAFTNNQGADVGTGGVFQVPSLRGLGLRAPYMHDGCAKTIEQRFDPACGGTKHGETAQLTATQIADLSAYLRTL